MFKCKCSYIEIYNEAIYDLLDSNGRQCSLREDTKKGGVYVEDCTQATIRSPAEAYELLSLGAQNRHVASTAMNRESSRSHSVFTLFIHSETVDGELVDIRESRFNLVDLAGSERQQLTGTVGLRLKEAGNINKSLLALSNVINALVETAGGRPRHVHYRDSKLTFLLRDSLGGNAKTCIIANVSPSPFSQAETLSTLRFAQRAKMIKNQAIVNKDLHGDVYQLQAEIRRLQSELDGFKSMQQEIPLQSLQTLQSLSGSALLEKRMSCIGISGEERQSLRIAMERQTELSSEVLKLKEQLEVTEELARRKDYQIQAEKMLRKLRESALREKGPIDASIYEEEISVLNGMLDHHPDVVRFAIDNTKLRERLGQIDQLTMEDFDALQSQIQRQQNHIDVLTRKLTEFDQRLEEKENEGAAAAETKRRRLSADTKLLEAQAEVVQMRENINLIETERIHSADILRGREVIIEELESRIHDMETHIGESLQTHQQEKATYERQLGSLKRELVEAQEHILKISQDLGQANGQLDQLRKENTELEEQILTLQSAHKAQLEQQSLTSQKQAEQQNKLHQSRLDNLLATQQSRLEEQDNRAASESARLKETILRLEASLAETQLNIGTLASELEAARSKSRELTRAMEKLRQDDALKSQSNEASTAQQEEMYVLRMELAHLRKTMADNGRRESDLAGVKDAKIKELENSVAGLEKTLSESQAKANESLTKANETIAKLQANQMPNSPKSPRIDETRYKLVMAENQQHLQKISRLENMLRNATEEASSSNAKEMETKLVRVQAAYNTLLAEKEGLQEDNAKLIQHHNSKQKLHYHVKIKEENNRLRQEIQALQADLARALDGQKVQPRAIDLTATESFDQ